MHGPPDPVKADQTNNTDHTNDETHTGGFPMPALPWVKGHSIDANGDYVAMASYLLLKSYRSIPGFLRDVLRIRRALSP